LPPEAFDYLAPERVAAGTPPSAASDAYACGCVWWHLLCGRPPLAGGDSLAKLRAAQAGEIHDLRRFAPEVPGPLEAAISACIQREPGRRPESMARLAATLGSSTRSGRNALAAASPMKGVRMRG
jgi:serine/threonine-protein kinase